MDCDFNYRIYIFSKVHEATATQFYINYFDDFTNLYCRKYDDYVGVDFFDIIFIVCNILYKNVKSYKLQQGRLRIIVFVDDVDILKLELKKYSFINIKGIHQKDCFSHFIVDTLQPLDYDFVENLQTNTNRIIKGFENYKNDY